MSSIPPTAASEPVPATSTPSTNKASLTFAGRQLLPRFVSAAALVLIPLLYFFPAVIGRVALLPGDGYIHNLGVRVLAAKLLAAGQLPLWNPYVFAGMPLLASVDPGALYPPNWIFILLPPAAAMNFLVITSFHLALIGTYLFARRCGFTRTGALVSGVIFSFGAYTVTHLEHTHRLTALVWLPWLLLALEALSASRGWRAAWPWVVLGALVIALQVFAGDPQTTVFTLGLSAFYALFLLARCDKFERGRLAVAALLMIVCGVLLSAIQLLPDRELMAAGERAQLTYEYFSSYSMPPRQVLSLIFPFFFGGAELRPFSVAYWGEWNAAVSACYVSLLGLLLALTAVWLARREARMWFWLLVAVVALLLSFGGYLPFELNRWLYRVPVYNLFRGPYRHLYEFTLALALLAGMGVNAIRTGSVSDLGLGKERAPQGSGRLRSPFCIAVIGALTISTALVYHSFRTLSEAEALVPLIIFALSAAVFWCYSKQPQSTPRACLLLIVLLLDLASSGWFARWRNVPNRVAERLSDPPTLQFIKQRERDLTAFRLLSLHEFPYDSPNEATRERNFDLLNWPDTSSARGVYCVNGNDLLRLPRLGAVAGKMDAGGFVQDLQAFGAADRGFDLLNTKYLFVEKRGARRTGEGITHDSVTFSKTVFGREFKPGARLTTFPENVTATELALVSTAYNSAHLPDGAPILKITLHTRDGRVFERELQAGRDTAEFAYDRADVRASIKHKKPPTVESRAGDGYEIHSYLAHLPFERAPIERIEWVFVREDAGLYLVRASLFDSETKTATPLTALNLAPERWRRLERFDDVTVYENLRPQPRAWFVNEVRVLSGEAVLKAIKQGVLPNEQKPFAPAELALLDETFTGQLPVIGKAADAQVTITNHQPQHVELRTRNAQPGFLVLSEAYYNGWEARVDGQPAQIVRTNYALRGVVTPPGEHRVEFVYAAPAFYRGAWLSALGAGILLLGILITGRRADAVRGA